MWGLSQSKMFGGGNMNFQGGGEDETECVNLISKTKFVIHIHFFPRCRAYNSNTNEDSRQMRIQFDTHCVEPEEPTQLLKKISVPSLIKLLERKKGSFSFLLAW